MSTNAGETTVPPTKRTLSGIKTVLQYTGIPPSWLDKRPKLPSRNWLIFISVTSSIASWYLYDRKQCQRIRQEYVDKVKHLAEVPLHSMDFPRKVTVYGCKWPADEEYDRSMKYFRKYVKPIFVAAAVDYEMINGRRHGDLTNKIIDKIKAQRRIAAGLDSSPDNLMNLPNKSPEDIRRRELEGGIVIVGRPTFKEFMAGLKRGWTESLEIVDREEALSNQLSTDGRFDEPEEEPKVEFGDVDGEPIPTASKLPPSQPMSILTAPHLRSPGIPVQPPPMQQKSTIPEALNAPPPTIPAMPPLLLVSFINHIGLTQIPLMIWEFFNEREKVRSGAEAAYRLIMGQTRPFIAPPPSLNNSESADEDSQTSSPSQPYQSELSSSPIPTDLEFDVDAEPYYKKSYVNDFASEIAKAREGYYKSLPEKLATTRSLARGEREPTKDEKSYPPPTEVELRAERMKKELRWTSDEAGWDIVRPSKPIEWDERLRGILHVFVDPSEEVVASTKPDAEGSTS